LLLNDGWLLETSIAWHLDMLAKVMLATGLILAYSYDGGAHDRRRLHNADEGLKNISS
jgi:hypothetical protein